MILHQDLQIALSVAMTDAAHRRHEHATVEHLLLALCLDAETAKVLGAAGAHIENLKEALEKFLADQIPALPAAQRMRAPEPSKKSGSSLAPKDGSAPTDDAAAGS